MLVGLFVEVFVVVAFVVVVIANVVIHSCDDDDGDCVKNERENARRSHLCCAIPEDTDFLAVAIVVVAVTVATCVWL